MTHTIFAKLTAWVAGLLLTQAPAPTTRPADTRPEATVTATTAPAVAPAAEKTLDRLEKAGQEHSTLRADIKYELEELAFEDKEFRTGSVYYDKDPTGKRPPRFRIHFDTVQKGEDGIKAKDDSDFVLDGRWFITRKAQVKQMVKYEVAKPGQKVDLLELGKGPFPVPFGQKKQSMLKVFVVTTRPTKPAEPKDTDYLLLIPRKQYRKGMRMSRLEMWVDSRGLPVRIVSTDPKGHTITRVDFVNIKSGVEFSKGTFALPRPPSQWEYRIEPWREDTAVEGP